MSKNHIFEKEGSLKRAFFLAAHATKMRSLGGVQAKKKKGFLVAAHRKMGGGFMGAYTHTAFLHIYGGGGVQCI